VSFFLVFRVIIGWVTNFSFALSVRFGIRFHWLKPQEWLGIERSNFGATNGFRPVFDGDFSE
jgi:hypothetical protein